MDWSLVIFILVVAIFAYRGFKNGLLKSLARVLSLIAAYASAIFFSAPLSRLVESQFGLQGIAAFAAASLTLFIGAYLLMSLLFKLIEHALPERESVSTASSLGGAAVGLVVGLLLAIAIVWTFAFVRDMRPSADSVADAGEAPSAIETLAGKAAGKAVTGALSLGTGNREMARLSAAVIESPAEVAQQAQRLAHSRDLQFLLGTAANQAVFDSGDYAAVRDLPDFQKLLQNRDMLALADSTGIVELADASGRSVEDELALQFTDIWGRTQRVKNDPRVLEIINDPEFQRQVQGGNPLELVTNSKLLELADIIFADDAAADGDAPATQAGSVEPASEKKTKIYSWTDENGKLHYSDIEPGS